MIILKKFCKHKYKKKSKINLHTESTVSFLLKYLYNIEWIYLEFTQMYN